MLLKRYLKITRPLLFFIHFFTSLIWSFCHSINIIHLCHAICFVDAVDTNESSIVPIWAHNTGAVTDTCLLCSRGMSAVMHKMSWGQKQQLMRSHCNQFLKAYNSSKYYYYLHLVPVNLSSEIIVSTNPQNLPEQLSLCAMQYSKYWQKNPKL